MTTPVGMLPPQQDTTKWVSTHESAMKWLSGWLESTNEFAASPHPRHRAPFLATSETPEWCKIVCSVPILGCERASSEHNERRARPIWVEQGAKESVAVHGSDLSSMKSLRGSSRSVPCWCIPHNDTRAETDTFHFLVEGDCTIASHHAWLIEPLLAFGTDSGANLPTGSDWRCDNSCR